MINISVEQAKKRFKTLPQEMKEALFSVQTAEIIYGIGTESHLTQEKSSELGRIAGLVFLGFLHKEDVAKELQGALSINSLMANGLQDSLIKKLFNPYADVLDKIYAPKPEEESVSRPQLDSVMAPPSAPVPATGPKPLASFAPILSAAPLPSASPKPAPVPVSSPKFTATPSPLPFLGAVPAKPMVAFSPSPVVPPPPTKPSPVVAPAPAPFMMQAETKVSPIAQAPKFTMESLGKAVSAFGGRTGQSMTPPKIAQVEIGEEEVQKPTGVVSKYTEAAPRTIHYSSLSTPLPPGLGASSSGPVSMGSLQGAPAAPSVPAPKPAMPRPEGVPLGPGAPSLPPPAGGPSGSGGFIKTLITPKGEKPDSSLPLPPQK